MLVHDVIISGGTTVTINYLKKWGWIKPIPSKEQLKVIYEGKKTALKEKVTATTGEIKDEFAKTRDEITQHMKEARTGFKQSAAETRDGFKEGIREAADEWRHVGRLVKRNVKEMIQKESKDSK